LPRPSAEREYLLAHANIDELFYYLAARDRDDPLAIERIVNLIEQRLLAEGWNGSFASPPT
jgi:hypothetical protein